MTARGIRAGPAPTSAWVNPTERLPARTQSSVRSAELGYLLCRRLSSSSPSSPASAVFVSDRACRRPAWCRCSLRGAPEIWTVGCAFAHCDRRSVRDWLLLLWRYFSSSLCFFLALADYGLPPAGQECYLPFLERTKPNDCALFCHVRL